MSNSQSNHRKTTNDKDYVAALEVVAANTMCMRKAVEAAARIGKTLIISTAVIAIAVVIIALVHDVTLVSFICGCVIFVFALFAIFYPLSLLTELIHITELVSEKEEEIADNGSEDEDD